MKDRRLLLINPNFVRKINGQLPLNLAYLAAAFKNRNVQVEIADLNVAKNPRETLQQSLDRMQPTHVGIARYSPSCRSSIEALEQVRSWNKDTILIAGGPHEAYCAAHTRKLYPWIHHVIDSRPAEQELVRIVMDDRMAVADWALLFPAYELLDLNEPTYQFDSAAFGGKRMITFMSARGCNLPCTFCSTPKYSAMELDVVIEQLKILIDSSYSAIFLNDPNFVSQVSRTRKFLEALIEHGIHESIIWGCQTIANETINQELLKLMAQAGCRYVTFSLENVSLSALRLWDKHITPEGVASKCRMAKEAGMGVGLYVMLGAVPNSQEDLNVARRTLDVLEGIRPNFVSYSIYAQYPKEHPPIDYETFQPSNHPVWEFFDEGHGYHPHCTDEHAAALMDVVLERHRGSLKDVHIF